MHEEKIIQFGHTEYKKLIGSEVTDVITSSNYEKGIDQIEILLKDKEGNIFSLMVAFNDSSYIPLEEALELSKKQIKEILHYNGKPVPPLDVYITD